MNWAAYPGLIVKESYWRWPERNLDGNAIDFFIHVMGMSFHDAMRAIVQTEPAALPPLPYDASPACRPGQGAKTPPYDGSVVSGLPKR